MHGDRLPVYGDGRQVRNWLYVEDFCRGIHTVLMSGRPGEAYNVGGPDECENIEVVKRVLELTGDDESLIEYVTDRPGHDRRYSLASDKVRTRSAGRRRRTSRRAWSGPSAGTATTRPGGDRSAAASTARTTRGSTAGAAPDAEAGLPTRLKGLVLLEPGGPRRRARLHGQNLQPGGLGRARRRG